MYRHRTILYDFFSRSVTSCIQPITDVSHSSYSDWKVKNCSHVTFIVSVKLSILVDLSMVLLEQEMYVQTGAKKVLYVEWELITSNGCLFWHRINQPLQQYNTNELYLDFPFECYNPLNIILNQKKSSNQKFHGKFRPWFDKEKFIRKKNRIKFFHNFCSLVGNDNLSFDKSSRIRP